MRRVLALAFIVASVAPIAGAAPPATDLVVAGEGGRISLVTSGGELIGTIAGYTAIAAAWSPDGTRFAFVGDAGTHRALAVAGADGSGVREVMRQPSGVEFASDLVWVSNGEVAFLRRPVTAIGYEMWLAPVDGGEARVLTRTAGLNAPLSMQPHGTLLAYSAYTPNIFTALVDVSTGLSRRLPETVSEVAWSPDGRFLATPAGNTIEIMRPDGTERRTLRALGRLQWVAWSPDGRRLAFARHRLFPELSGRGVTPSRQDVFTIGVDGSGLRRLTGVEGDAIAAGGHSGSSRPSWWPNGSRLFFRRGEGGPLLLTNLDGSCEQRWPGPVPQTSPRWRPGAGASVRSLECSSVVVRLRTTLGEVGHRSPFPLTVVVRNDGTRTLRDVRLTVTTTRGAAVLRGAGCVGTGQVVCPLGDLEPDGQRVLLGRVVFGTPGRPTVTASAAYAGGGDVDPTDDSEAVSPGVSSCDVLGTWGADRLVGTNRAELICGRPGKDVIDGRGGDDRIEAGSGDDTVRGGSGRDRVDGAGGADTIRVRDGRRDTVFCGSERDVVVADRLDRIARDCESIRRG